MAHPLFTIHAVMWFRPSHSLAIYLADPTLDVCYRWMCICCELDCGFHCGHRNTTQGLSFSLFVLHSSFVTQQMPLFGCVILGTNAFIHPAPITTDPVYIGDTRESVAGGQGRFRRDTWHSSCDKWHADGHHHTSGCWWHTVPHVCFYTRCLVFWMVWNDPHTAVMLFFSLCLWFG